MGLNCRILEYRSFVASWAHVNSWKTKIAQGCNRKMTLSKEVSKLWTLWLGKGYWRHFIVFVLFLCFSWSVRWWRCCTALHGCVLCLQLSFLDKMPARCLFCSSGCMLEITYYLSLCVSCRTTYRLPGKRLTSFSHIIHIAMDIGKSMQTSKSDTTTLNSPMRYVGSWAKQLPLVPLAK